MLLIVARENPDPINNLSNVVKAFDARKIPYILVRKCDPAMIHRKDIRGVIIPGTNHFRIIPYEIQPELELELYYLYHFPKLPVLGLCHGCQFLSVYYGCQLMKYDTFWHGGKEVELDLTVDNLFHGEEQIQQLEVYFRDLPIAPKKAGRGRGRGIREIAWLTSYRDNLRHACAFEFEKDRVYGFMFHPEAKESSWPILYNFYDRVCLHSAGGADSAKSHPS
jgi:anthranilate/para-aminobenzoate synthase component II